MDIIDINDKKYCRVIGTGTEVNPQSWTQHLLFICEEEH